MNDNTFSDSKQYKMLPRLTELISGLEDNPKNYLSSFISKFNKIVNDIRWIKYPEFVTDEDDKKLINHLLDLVQQDYEKRTDDMFDKYHVELVSYLKNYIHAKIKNAKL